MRSSSKNTISKSTLIRNILMLNFIPQSPGKVSVSLLVERLGSAGFEISARTVQRDLKALQDFLPIEFEEDEGKKYRWFWLPGFQPVRIHAMDPRMCVIIILAQVHLEERMPTALRQHVEKLAASARNTLAMPGLNQYQKLVASLMEQKEKEIDD